MIVRILTEGQYDLPGEYVDALNKIDNDLVEVVEKEDENEFRKLLGNMLGLVREKGVSLQVEELVESDLVLPEPDLTMEEAGKLFTGEGLLPG